MNFLLGLLCILGFLTTIVAGQNNCANPLWVHCKDAITNTSAYEFCDIEWESTVVAKSNNKLCPEIAAGASCCCSDIVFDVLTATWLIYKARVELALLVLEATKIKAIAFDVVIDALLLSVNGWNITSDEKTAFINYFNTIKNATNLFVASVVPDWQACTIGLLKYYAGLLCFGCEANWNEFIIYDANTGNVTIIFDTNSCVQLQGYCVPFLKDIEAYVQSLVTALEILVETLVLDTTQNANIDSVTLHQVWDRCGGDCPKFVCAHFIFGISFSAAFGQESSSSEGSQNLGRERISARDSAHLRVLRNDMENAVPGSWEAMADLFDDIGSAISTMHGVNRKSGVALRDVPISQTNTYSSGGYPVIDVGSNSGFAINGSGTSSNGDAAHLANWISMFL